MSGSKLQKYSFLNVLRFIFSLIVVLSHSFLYSEVNVNNFPFKNGYLCVEFFFIVSGFFTIAHIERNRELYFDEKEFVAANLLKYIKSKFVRLFPYTTFVIIINLLSRLIIYGTEDSVKEILPQLPFDILLISHFGFSVKNNGYATWTLNILWYIGTMLTTLTIISYIYVKHKDFCKNILFVIGPPLIYGYLIRSCGSIIDAHRYMTYQTVGLLRSLAGISLGGLIYIISGAVKSKNINRYLGSFIEIICFTSSILLMRFSDYRYEMFTVFLFVIGLIFLFSEQNNLDHVFRHRLSDYLGELSLTIYLGHYTLLELIEAKTDICDLKLKVALGLAASVLWGIVIKASISRLMKLLRCKNKE